MIDEKFTGLEIALSMYSDAHKDAFGFRPKTLLQFATEEDIWEAIQDLQPIIDENIRRLAEDQECAHRDWHRRITAMANDYGVSFTTALRWDFDANGLHLADDEYYCYIQNISYTWVPYIKDLFANENGALTMK